MQASFPNDRRRLLILSAAVLVMVSLTCVGVCYFELHSIVGTERARLRELALDHAASAQTAATTGESLESFERSWRHTEHRFQERWRQSRWFCLSAIAVILTGGGTLLLRVSNGFMKQLEESESQAAAKAEQLTRLNRELDDFSCVVSHDLKEPLHGIAGYCELLRDEYELSLDAQGRRMLNGAVSLCQRMSKQIDALLAYSRIGWTRPKRSEVNLRRVADDVLNRLSSTIGERGATVRVADQLPTLYGDPLLVAEVLQNLVSNALKFNTSHAPQVEVGSLPGEMPTVFVRDNGIGIAREHRDAVFGMFRRLHNRREYEGTGAGLSIVRKIVEAHGGQVWVESTPGAGSTFFFTLGAAAPQPSTLPRPHLERALRLSSSISDFARREGLAWTSPTLGKMARASVGLGNQPFSVIDYRGTT